MKHCEICGTTKGEIKGKSGKYEMDLCVKHYTHMQDFGYIKDRTRFDANEFIVNGDILEIVLYDKKNKEKCRAITNAIYLNKVKDRKWSLDGHGYVTSGTYGKHIKLHRLIMDAPKGMYVDHIFHDKLDNRIEHLRVCTNSENVQNQDKQPNNTSGHKGVWWDKSRNKWAVQIRANSQRFNIGRFVNKQDAIKAYDDAAIKYQGEFRYRKCD